MKNRTLVSLLGAALIMLPALSHADEVRFDFLRVYKLANGQAVAVAVPPEWRELSATRILKARAPARFIDESGRQVEISAAELERAAAAKSIAWGVEGHAKTKVAAR